MSRQPVGDVVRVGAAMYAAAVVVNTIGAPPESAVEYLQWVLDYPEGGAILWLGVVSAWIAATRQPIPAAGVLVFALGPLLLETYLLYEAVQFFVREYHTTPPGSPLPTGLFVSPNLWAQRVGASLLFFGSHRLARRSDGRGTPEGSPST